MDLGDQFDHRPEGVYLDTASIGLVPRAVREALGVAAGALGAGTQGAAVWHPVVARVTAALAGEFGVEPAQIAYLATTGEAMNATARAVPFGAGEEVLVLADDFPNVRLPWSALPGVSLHELPRGAESRTAQLIAALRPETRVVAVAHVHASTGEAVDLGVLGRACRANGTLLVVDAAQAAGVLVPDLSHVDVYIATGYKWLLAGFGIAVVITGAGFAEAARPGLLGYGNAPPSRGLVYGHRNLYGLFALDAATALRHALGLAAIRAHVAGLVAELAAGLRDCGLAPLAADAGLVSCPVQDGADAVSALQAAGIHAAARDGHLRLSPYLYSRPDEITRALEQIRAATRAGTIRPACPPTPAPQRRTET